ncbi:MAG: SRPBCC domain-containing protein [Rhizobacter sp.]|nr:SRPBCC domain-containing protein [Ferruginibacter sp.]
MDISANADTHNDHIITTIRDVNASTHFVFKAWADPVHLRNWWGPKGFTNTFNDFDLRPGGHWSFVMHGPDGGNYANESIFLEIQEPSLISFDHVSPPVFKVIATFEPLTESTTRITYRMLFRTAEELQKIEKMAPEKNEELFDRLENELIQMKQDGNDVAVNQFD